MDKLKRTFQGLYYCLILGIVAASVVDPSENEVDVHGNIRSSHHVKSSSPAVALPNELDVFHLINISSKDPGVSAVEGPIPRFTAYKFRLPYGNMPLSNTSSLAVARALGAPEGFTAVFVYRQQRGNLGTLLSVNSPGRLTPWVQLTSNARTSMLVFKYRVEGSGKLRQMEWALPKHYKKAPMAAWTWMSISVDFTTGIARVDFDCQPSRFESLTPSNSRARIAVPEDALVYFRQEPGRKKKFLGSMQVAKILPYVSQERLWNCLKISPNLAPELSKPIL